MGFTGQISGEGRFWSDPSGLGTWVVPDGYDPQTSPYNPANASRNTSAGWSQGLGTSLAPTPTLNATPFQNQEATPFTDPAMNAPVYGALASPQAAANPLAQSMGGMGAGSGSIGANLGGMQVSLSDPLAQSLSGSYRAPTWTSPTATPGGPPEGTPMPSSFYQPGVNGPSEGSTAPAGNSPGLGANGQYSGTSSNPYPVGGTPGGDGGGLGSILPSPTAPLPPTMQPPSNALAGALVGNAGSSGGLGSMLGGSITPPTIADPDPRPSGPLTPDGYRTGVNNGTIPAGNVTRPVVDDFGGFNSNPSMGNQQAAATQLPQDLTDALRQLMQNALDQGKQGQEAYTGITEDIRKFLNFSQNATTQSMGRQDELTNQMLRRINPALDEALGLMNKSEGLSPGALAAMNTNATEGAARSYAQGSEALKTELARRGAAGGGDMPGSAGDIARGYGPLIAAREGQRAQGLRETILADEQRKFESLGLNRSTAMNALGQASNLTGTLGQIYDPSKFLNSSQNAMGQLTNIVGARNDQASNALNQAGALGQALAGNQLTGTTEANRLAENKRQSDQLLAESKRQYDLGNTAEGARLAEQARQANMGNTTDNRRIDLDLASTSTGQILKNALIGTGFGALGNLLTGGSGDGGLIDKWLKDRGGSSQSSVPGGTGPASGGGVGSKIAGFLKDPLTIAIGAGILGVTAWLKSQAHHEANTFVRSFQNQFDQEVGQINDQFFELAQSGKLSKSQATDIRASIKAAIDEYERQRIEFSKQGSDEKTVADQAKATSDQWYGADYKPYLKKLDDTIAGLA